MNDKRLGTLCSLRRAKDCGAVRSDGGAPGWGWGPRPQPCTHHPLLLSALAVYVCSRYLWDNKCSSQLFSAGSGMPHTHSAKLIQSLYSHLHVFILSRETGNLECACTTDTGNKKKRYIIA